MPKQKTSLCIIIRDKPFFNIDIRCAVTHGSVCYKGRNENLATIGRTLGVAAVLQGSVRRAGNKVRVTAQLMNAHDGFQLWSERFDRDLDDIFPVTVRLTEQASDGALDDRLDSPVKVGRDGRVAAAHRGQDGFVALRGPAIGGGRPGAGDHRQGGT